MPDTRKTIHRFLSQAIEVAETGDVTAPKDGLILYTTSYQPTQKNKDDAFSYWREDAGSRILLDVTPVGQALLAMDLFNPLHGLTREQIYSPWFIAARRFVMAAKGNVTAFIEDADPRSTFACIELHSLHANNKISSMNGIPKKTWFQNVLPHTAPCIGGIENPRIRLNLICQTYGKPAWIL